MTDASVADTAQGASLESISYGYSDTQLDLFGDPMPIPRSVFKQVMRRNGFQAANQGQSDLATPAKQQGLIGMYRMLTLMRKKLREKKGIKNLIYMDMYSGIGENVADGQRIYGSPISMLEGIHRAVRSMNDGPGGVKRHVVFNDIVKGRASEMLPQRVLEFQEDRGLQRNPELLVSYTKQGDIVEIPIIYRDGSAQSLAKSVINRLNNPRSSEHYIIAVDPNGPKHAPWNELEYIWNNFSNHAEFIFHISATTLKRIAKARESGIKANADIPNHVQAMLDKFAHSKGWVRNGVGADYWTLMLLTKFSPDYGWGKDYHLIDSPEGQKVIRSLSLTKKEMAEVAL